MRYVLLGLLVTVGCASAPPTPVAPRQPQRVLPPAPAKAPMLSLLTSEAAAGLSPESLQRMHELLRQSKWRMRPEPNSFSCIDPLEKVPPWLWDSPQDNGHPE